MTLASPTLSPDFRRPLLIQRGLAQTLGIRLRDGTSVVTPASGVVSIYRDTAESNLYVSAAITPGTTSTYDLAAVASTEPLSSAWIVSWVIVSGGVTYTFRQRAVLVGMIPSLRVACEDLYGGDGVPELRHPSRLPAGQVSWNPQIQAAGDEVFRTLTATGKEPWLAVDDVTFYDLHLALSVAKACSAVPSGVGEFFTLKASEWTKKASDAYLALVIEYAASPGKATSTGPSSYPCSPVGRPRW